MHFLAGVELPTRGSEFSDPQGRPRMLVDVFHQGRVLTPEEFLAQVRRGGTTDPVRPQDLLPLATPRTWLARMLQNLVNVFQATGRRDDVDAMLELGALLLGRESADDT